MTLTGVRGEAPVFDFDKSGRGPITTLTIRGEAPNFLTSTGRGDPFFRTLKGRGELAPVFDFDKTGRGPKLFDFDRMGKAQIFDFEKTG